MELYIDTANILEIKEAAELGVISGVTTNPTLIAKEGRDFREVIKEITAIVDGPISAEVTGLSKEEMVKEGEELAEIHANIVIKIPLIPEGLKAINSLSVKGIKTNATLIFSANQAILAANAGADYISPFVGRLDDIGNEGMNLIGDIKKIIDSFNYKTKIIAASIRHPLHVAQAALQGAHISTVPYKVLLQMCKHPLTDLGVERFLQDWEALKNK